MLLNTFSKFSRKYHESGSMLHSYLPVNLTYLPSMKTIPFIIFWGKISKYEITE
jgi:hypothetical protein